MNLNDIAKSYHDEDSARTFLEAERWPKGEVNCPHCGEIGKAYRLQPKENGKTWLMAIHLLCSSKKGMSAHQLHRMLGITYKSAWFMAHRIRYAMAQLNLPRIGGTVEVDETYIGSDKRGKQGSKKNKAPVVALVEGGGTFVLCIRRESRARRLSK